MTKPKSKIYFHISVVISVLQYNVCFELFKAALSTILSSYRTQSGNLLTLLLGMHRPTVL